MKVWVRHSVSAPVSSWHASLLTRSLSLIGEGQCMESGPGRIPRATAGYCMPLGDSPA